MEKIPQHSEYKTCELEEKALTKDSCKQVFPIAEQLKTQLIDKYQKEYDDYLQLKVLLALVHHSIQVVIMYRNNNFYNVFLSTDEKTIRSGEEE